MDPCERSRGERDEACRVAQHDGSRDPTTVDDPGEDARKRNFDDHPVGYSIEMVAMIVYIAGVASISGHLDFPFQQLVLAAGLALGVIVLKLTRSIRK